MTGDARRVRRPFLPQTRREWTAAGSVVLLGGLFAGLLSLVHARVSDTVFSFLLLAVIALEPWLHERYTQRSGRASPHVLHRGRMGIVTVPCEPTGRATVDGTSWVARSLNQEPLAAGECVYIHDGQGLVLLVSRSEPQPH